MCDLHEAAENIARMEAAYEATGMPVARDATPEHDKPSERVENAALGVAALALMAGFLFT